jgi:hypothetical protein
MQAHEADAAIVAQQIGVFSSWWHGVSEGGKVI